MTVHKLQNYAAAIVFLLMVTWLWFTVIKQFTESGPPVEMHGTEISATTARPGQTVWVMVDRTRNRYCPGQAHQFWRSPDGDVVQAGIEPTSPSRELGRQLTRFSKRVPEDIAPKRWCYAPQLVYECPDGPYYIEQPAACLTVLAPGE